MYKPSPRYWGYKNASRSIRRHPEFLSELSDREILAIPGVGPATLRIVREFLDGRRIADGRADRVGEREGEGDRGARALRRNFLSAAMVQKVLSGAQSEAPVRREDYGGDFQMHSRGSDGSDTHRDAGTKAAWSAAIAACA